uniref:uncharacterized protein n=1 Tax=Myxine glutinosa TaxID=7769 RepID=UPI00359016CF
MNVTNYCHLMMARQKELQKKNAVPQQKDSKEEKMNILPKITKQSLGPKPPCGTMSRAGLSQKKEKSDFSKCKNALLLRDKQKGFLRKHFHDNKNIKNDVEKELEDYLKARLKETTFSPLDHLKFARLPLIPISKEADSSDQKGENHTDDVSAKEMQQISTNATSSSAVEIAEELTSLADQKELHPMKPTINQESTKDEFHNYKAAVKNQSSGSLKTNPNLAKKEQRSSRLPEEFWNWPKFRDQLDKVTLQSKLPLIPISKEADSSDQKGENHTDDVSAKEMQQISTNATSSSAVEIAEELTSLADQKELHPMKPTINQESTKDEFHNYKAAVKNQSSGSLKTNPNLAKKEQRSSRLPEEFWNWPKFRDQLDKVTLQSKGIFLRAFLVDEKDVPMPGKYNTTGSVITSDDSSSNSGEDESTTDHEQKDTSTDSEGNTGEVKSRKKRSFLNGLKKKIFGKLFKKHRSSFKDESSSG